MSIESTTESIRERLTNLFQFLKAYTDLRFPPIRDIGKQPRWLWLNDLPAHPSVELVRDTNQSEDETKDGDIVLRVTRPVTTQCPPPPAALADWVKPGWQELAGQVDVQPTRNLIGKDGRTVIERFDSDRERLPLLRTWEQQREQWITNERPARESLALFQTVYEWYGILEREGERMELLVGDGLLRCPDLIGEFRHPVLLQKLELEPDFKQRQPKFIFRKRDQPPELYMEFLRVLPGVNSQQLPRCAAELKEAEFAPLGGGDTDGFFQRLINGLFPSGGTVVETDPGMPDRRHNLSPASDLPLFITSSPSARTNDHTIKRQPVVFMRQRRTGPGNVFDWVLEDIASQNIFPSALLQILGFEPTKPLQSELEQGGLHFGNEDEEVLLSKSANREQLEIARQLARKDCVLVQGPPGTGKTHTIANLLGHLLAQGKRVLVTAHTPKALRVLREKVAEPLQPLCVSVLHNDKQSQEELQNSIRHIGLSLVRRFALGAGRWS